MEPINIGIIGIGGFARTLLGEIFLCERMGIARLSALAVRSPKKYADGLTTLQKGRNLRIYESWEEMYRKEKGNIRLMVIPTGIDSHAEQSVKALEAGYHVMCEKPAAGTLADALSMKKAAEETGNILAIGYQNIFSPTIQRIKEVRLNKSLGELIEARSYACWPRTSVYYNRNNWAGKLRKEGSLVYDSPIQNALAHYLQNLLYVAGPEKRSSARPFTVYGENYHCQPIESADTQFIRAETQEGPVLSFGATHAAKTTVQPRAEFLFEQGRISWEFMKETRIWRKEGAKEILEDVVENGRVPMEDRVMRDVVMSLHHDLIPLSHIGNAWQHTLCVNRLFEASPVHDVADEFRALETKEESYNGMWSTGKNWYIPCIEEAMEGMFLQGKGFYEAGLPWAKEGKILKA